MVALLKRMLAGLHTLRVNIQCSAEEKTEPTGHGLGTSTFIVPQVAGAMAHA